MARGGARGHRQGTAYVMEAMLKLKGREHVAHLFDKIADSIRSDKLDLQAEPGRTRPPAGAGQGGIEVVMAQTYRPGMRRAPRAAAAAKETGLSDHTVAKVVGAAKPTVEPKKSNDLNGSGEIPHSAEKTKAKKSGRRSGPMAAP